VFVQVREGFGKIRQRRRALLSWTRGRRFKSCQPDRETASDLRKRSSEAVVVPTPRERIHTWVAGCAGAAADRYGETWEDPASTGIGFGHVLAVGSPAILGLVGARVGQCGPFAPRSTSDQRSASTSPMRAPVPSLLSIMSARSPVCLGPGRSRLINVCRAPQMVAMSSRVSDSISLLGRCRRPVCLTGVIGLPSEPALDAGYTSPGHRASPDCHGWAETSSSSSHRAQRGASKQAGLRGRAVCGGDSRMRSGPTLTGARHRGLPARD
jgi:hypothetical protein